MTKTDQMANLEDELAALGAKRHMLETAVKPLRAALQAMPVNARSEPSVSKALGDVLTELETTIDRIAATKTAYRALKHDAQ